MKTVPLNVIHETWERQCTLEDAKANQLMEQFFKVQPAVAAYLVAAEEGLEVEDGTDLIPLGVLVWEVLTNQRHAALPEVTADNLENAEANNIQFLQDLDGGSEMAGINATENLLTNFNQRPLFEFILEILMSESEDSDAPPAEHTGMQLLHLKTIIDCLDS